MSTAAISLEYFLADPASVLEFSMNVPRSYLAAERLLQKEAFLKRFSNLVIAPEDSDVAETKNLWQQIISRTGPHRSGAAEEHFKVFSETTGFPFPPNLRAIYEMSDGAKNAILGYDLMPMDRLLEYWQGKKELFDDWDLDALLEKISDGEYTIGIHASPFRI